MAGNKLICTIASAAVLLGTIGVSASILCSADTLNDYQSRQQALEKQAAEYQAQIESTSSDIAKQEEYKAALQNKITVLNEQIVAGREQITALDKDISSLQTDLDKSRSKISGRIDKLKQRVKALYVSGDTTSLEIILGAKDFSDFLDKLEVVTYISKSDQALISSLQDDIDEINRKRSTLKEKKTTLSNEQNKLTDRQKEMQMLINENEKLLDNLNDAQQGAQDHLDAANAEMKAIEDQITAYFKNKEAQEKTAKIASEAKKNLAEASSSSSKTESSTAKHTIIRQSEQNPSNTSSQHESGASAVDDYDEDSEDYYYEDDEDSDSDSSSSQASSSQAPQQVVEDTSDGYVWPVPGHYTLSSVWNEDRTTYNHGAIDISDGSIMNAQVVAAESGVVVLYDNECDHNYGKDGSCGCGGGYGRYIMIDHGNGKATLYAHMTDIVVNEGDYVQKGQLVGYVGTTGWSTGPHLHFETRLNGEKYNPMNEYPNI